MLNQKRAARDRGRPARPVLQGLPATAAAYSMRRLRDDYSGQCVNVRRSVDNATTDIGFAYNRATREHEIDRIALADFVGGQNLLTYSETFENAAWEGLGNSSETISVNSDIAPDGTTTADKCTVTSASSGRYQQITLSAAGKLTLSVYLKSGGTGTWCRVGIYDYSNPSNQARCWVNMETGALGTVNTVGTGWSDVSASISAVGNGWYRVSITATCAATAVATLLANADADNNTTRTTGHNRIIWGAQLNTGYVRPYSQTTTPAKTGNGYITTWYDQSGNGRNVVQTTAANQPLIVSAGVINTQNSKPATLFGGALSLATAATFGTAAQRTVISVNTYDNSQSLYQHVWEQASSGGSSGNGFLIRVQTLNDWTAGDVFAFGDGHNNGRAPRFISNDRTQSTALDIYSVSLGTIESMVRINGADAVTRVASTGTFVTSSAVFGISRTTGSQGLIGSVSELIYVDGDISATDRKMIEKNQGRYYGIGVSA